MADLRDRLHNLDMTDEDHIAVYKRERNSFLIEGENAYEWAYDDKNRKQIREGVKVIGKVTVGIGFNMSRDEDDASRREWNLAFHGTVDFDAVKAGKLALTKEQIEKLFQVSLDMRAEELETSYSPSTWKRLRANERLAIESAYYNGPNLVRGGTSFHKYILYYSVNSKKEELLKAVDELRYRSNKYRVAGHQSRREREAELLDSTKCPFYSGPFDDLCPEKPCTAIIGKTVLPRGVDTWARPEVISRYYIWRTKMDEKVRPHHAAREGKVYDSEDTSILHPKADHNCRCYGVPVPHTITLARTDRKSYYNPMTATFTLRHLKSA